MNLAKAEQLFAGVTRNGITPINSIWKRLTPTFMSAINITTIEIRNSVIGPDHIRQTYVFELKENNHVVYCNP